METCKVQESIISATHYATNRITQENEESMQYIYKNITINIPSKQNTLQVILFS